MSNAPNGRNEIPDGVRDKLPREAAQMRRLSDRLAEIFASWGYREVLTPGFEYLETVTAGAGSQGKREDLYQFFDRKGRTLALRPDMTAPIARLAVTKMGSQPLPLRLSYVAPVYRRRERKAGSMHEIWQAGIELAGASGSAADAEVIALACAALDAAGLKHFKIGLGHVDFVEGVFAEAGLDPAREAELKDAMGTRDLVAFEKGVREAGLSDQLADLLLAMATFQGTFEEALDRFRGVGPGRVARALEQLGTTLALLKDFGMADQVFLDLGLVRSLGYYTGIVFEGYTPGVGSPVLGGGRYDNLLADFGGDAPATGFALEMDRVLIALERQGRLPAESGLDVVVACPPGSEAEAMAWARDLRQEGLTVEVDLLGRTGEELLAYGKARRVSRVIHADGTEEKLSSGASVGGNIDRTRTRQLDSIH